MGEQTGAGHPVRQVHFVTRFTCDSARCTDSCCKRYEIVRIEDYVVEHLRTHEPDLLQYVVQDSDGWAMKVDERRHCPACIENLCHMQVRCGPTLIPEICHIFPRRFTRLFGEVFISSNLPCNLMVEEALYGDRPFEWDVVQVPRIPTDLGNTREADFPGHTPDELFGIHREVMRLAEHETWSSEDLLMRLLLLAGRLDGLRRSDWSYMVSSLVRSTARENAIEHLPRLGQMPSQAEDSLHDLLYTVLTVVKHREHEKLRALLKDVATLVEGRTPASLREQWQECSQGTPIEGVLKRYLCARLTENLFPVANWGDCIDDMAFIAVSYTLLRLCLLVRHQQLAAFTDQEQIVDIVTVVENWYYGRRKDLYSQLVRMGWTSAEAIQAALQRS